MRPPASPAVLEATLHLIARGGVDAVRYRDVSRESGVPLGTVSYHYPARDDLIHAAFAHFLEQNTASIAALESRLAVDEIDEVADLLTELLRADLDDPSRRFLAEYELIVYASRDPVIAESLAAWDRATVAALARTLEKLGMPAPLAAAQTLVDLLRGFQLANLGRDRHELDDFHSRVRRLLLALAAQPLPASPASRKSPERRPNVEAAPARRGKSGAGAGRAPRSRRPR